MSVDDVEPITCHGKTSWFASCSAQCFLVALEGTFFDYFLVGAKGQLNLSNQQRLCSIDTSNSLAGEHWIHHDEECTNRLHDVNPKCFQ